LSARGLRGPLSIGLVCVALAMFARLSDNGLGLFRRQSVEVRLGENAFLDELERG
jgi:hypothetical protein